MTPLQKSYTITDESLEGLKSTFYNDTKITELENKDELTQKEQKELSKQKEAKELASAIISKLNGHKDGKKYLNKDEFISFLKQILDIKDTKTLDKIAKIFSRDDDEAQIQRDKKGEIIYDKDSRDSEIININANIDEYMKSEVLPHLPLAKAFDEGKIGAEIPFTRYFYKYQSPKSTDEIKLEFKNLEKEAIELESGIFDE